MGVTPTMLLKTHVEKMFSSRDPTMLMKTSNIEFICHDVYENTGSYLKLQIENSDGRVRPRPLVSPRPPHLPVEG